MQDKMTHGEDVQPSVGGANLECLLTCQNIPVKLVSDLLNVCYFHKFALVEQGSLLAYGEDPIEPLLVASAKQSEDFLKEIEHQSVQSCIANMVGILVDVQTPMSLLIDFKNSVVSISVPEDFLWNFLKDTAQANFQRLKAFAKCCDDIAAKLSPAFGFIGTETLHTEDMRLDKAEQEGAFKFDDSFFSEGRLKELFNWYLNNYVRRWEK